VPEDKNKSGRVQLLKRYSFVLMAGLGLSLLANIFLGLQLRSRYENELARQIWPAHAEKPEIVSSPNNDVSPTILLLGDSRMAEWHLPQPKQGRIVNAGMPGATTAQIKDCASGYLQQYHPEIVIIQAGINDLKLLGVRPDLRLKVVSNASENLGALVGQCVNSHCKVLLLLTWPPGKPELLRRPLWSATVSDGVNDLNRDLNELNAPEKGVFVCDLMAETGQSIAGYRDALHLKPETYQQLTPVLDRHLEQLQHQSK
jgi:lysophospholipase L1-like esterase